MPLATIARRCQGGACQLAKKGGNTNNMKYLTIIALAAAALCLGACAKDEQQSHSSHQTHSASSGMSK